VDMGQMNEGKHALELPLDVHFDLQADIDAMEQLLSIPLVEPPQTERGLMKSLDQEMLRESAYEAVVQIDNDTDVFALVHDLGFHLGSAQDDRFPCVKKGVAIHGRRIRYNSRVPSGFGAVFRPGQVPRVKGAAPDVEDLMFSLVNNRIRGSFPEAMSEAMEERLHELHYQTQERIINAGRWTLQKSVGISGGIPLYEALAKRLVGEPFGMRDERNVEQMASDSRMAYLQTGDYPQERWESAFRAIDTLIVYGFQLPGILELLVKYPKYNAEQGRYADLEQAVMEKLAEKGLDSADPSQVHAQFVMNKRRNMQQARLIARQKLVECCQKQQIPVSEKWLASFPGISADCPSD